MGGGGSTYDYGFRIYNPGIAKFLSVDPLSSSYPWYTPYQFAGNNPVKFIDLDGLEEYDPMGDVLFAAKMVLTTFYDVKHSAENLLLNTFVPADPGMKWQASYKENENGDEIFETIIQQVPRQGALKEALNTGLDVANVFMGGKLDATDLISVKTGGNTQLTRGVREAVGEYSKVGGHHVHAKAGFKNHLIYDPDRGFSRSQDFMKQHGLDHLEMTKTQRKLFDELSKSGRSNTLEEHSRIAKEALISGGASNEMATDLMEKSLKNLEGQGVSTPSNIPWNKKE